MSVKQSNPTQGTRDAASDDFSIDNSPQFYIGRNRSISEAFSNSTRGMVSAFKSERIFRLHLSFIVGGVIVGFLLHLTLAEWALGLACAFAILVVELINTAIERMTDLLAGYQYHRLAKDSKDIAAGAVLLTLYGSLAVLAFMFAGALVRLASQAK